MMIFWMKCVSSHLTAGTGQLSLALLAPPGTAGCSGEGVRCGLTQQISPAEHGASPPTSSGGTSPALSQPSYPITDPQVISWGHQALLSELFATMHMFYAHHYGIVVMEPTTTRSDRHQELYKWGTQTSRLSSSAACRNGVAEAGAKGIISSPLPKSGEMDAWKGAFPGHRSTGRCPNFPSPATT